MPRGDGTGPEGRGPQTGRGAGYCSGYNQPGYANQEVPRQQLGPQGQTGRGRGQAGSGGRGQNGSKGRGQGRNSNGRRGRKRR